MATTASTIIVTVPVTTARNVMLRAVADGRTPHSNVSREYEELIEEWVVISALNCVLRSVESDGVCQADDGDRTRSVN